jgi:hypothetical protein
MAGYDHNKVRNNQSNDIESLSALYGHIYVVVPATQHPKGFITMDCVKDNFDSEHQSGNIAIVKDYPINALQVRDNNTSRLNGGLGGLFGYTFPADIPNYYNADSYSSFIDKAYKTLAYILDNSDRLGSYDVCRMLIIVCNDITWGIQQRAEFRGIQAKALESKRIIGNYEAYAITSYGNDKTYQYDKGKLNNGCKLQVPDMSSAFDADKLASLKAAAKLLPKTTSQGRSENSTNPNSANSTTNGTNVDEVWYKKTPVIVGGAVLGTCLIGGLIYLIAK